MDPLDPVRLDFLQRIRPPKLWGLIAFTAPRGILAIALVFGPLLLLAGATLLAPPGFIRNVVDPDNVQLLFSRFLTATATASAIAVAMAALTFRPEIQGVGPLRTKLGDNESYRDRLGAATGGAVVPLPLGAFLGSVLNAIQAHADQARSLLRPEDAARSIDGIALGDLLDAIRSAIPPVVKKLAQARENPDLLFAATLDFETEVTHYHAHLHARNSAAPEALRDALHALESRIEDLIVGEKYAKGLALQWGLSRMALAILLAAVPSLLTASTLVLAYPAMAESGWTPVAALALVTLALSVVVLPFTVFVSYILRFVFINEYTLPTDGFVLGPENAPATERARPLRPGRGRARFRLWGSRGQV